MRKTLSLVALAAGCGLLAASAVGAVDRRAPSGGTFRISWSVDIDHVDPAVAYSVPSWTLEYATGAMLVSYPDAPAPRGARLVPEVARGFPTISRDGRTYTFRLRRTYRFSDGRPVTAAAFVRAIVRAKDERMASPARSLVEDLVAAQAIGRYTLRVRTSRRAGDLLARLAMPFFMAVPPDTPISPEGVQAPVASAGPYFVSEWTKDRRIVLRRNGFYRGPRPRQVRRIDVEIGFALETIKLKIDRGAVDWGDVPPVAHSDLGRRHGVSKQSPGRYFVAPSPTILYLAMNHDRPLFGGPSALGNVGLKRAVSFAVDRAGILLQRGGYGATVNDQLLPPTIRGFADARIYPRRQGLARARSLAQGNLRGGEGMFACRSRAPFPAMCQIVQANLRRIGLNLDIRLCPRGLCPDDRVRTRGEPFDVSLESWRPPYADPYGFFSVVDGTTIRPTENDNVSYFNHPGFNARIQAARRLSGDARYRAFARLDADLMRRAAPVAVVGVYNDRHYVSARTGCYHHHPVYSFDLPAICVR